MANSKGGLGMYMRLQIAYALEFAIWGCWSYMLGGWGEANHVNPGWLYSAFAFGALFAPVFGPIADSKYSAQKVFAFMQFLCGVALLACSFLAKSAASAAAEKIATNPDYVGSPGVPWLIAMFFAGLMFMPSIPLLNAIVFKHIPNDKKAPFVFIFGTLGWIAINLILGIKALNGLETFFLIDGAIAIVLAIYALTLPDTPPAGSVNKDPFGLKAVSFLLSKRASFVFLLCATMVGIFGSNYYFPLVDPCFPGKGVFNQYSEIIFMAALAFAVAKIGLRWVLTLGMLTWGIRYYFFSTGNDSLALAGILLHGIAYAFLYTAAYMYGDKIAPKEMKASVQALIAFLLLGVAQVLSGIAVSEAKDRYKVGAVDDAPAVESTEKASADTEAFYFFSTPAFAQDELTLPEVEETNELAQVAQDVQEAAADVAQAAEDVAA
ncbi:MAG: MFS transporter, partial [Planctomycetia bacterium]|nr:MFS transporter [Planctomycetia bacterium]